ncbi:FAD/FMN-containing dehydrogenase/ribosomal protein S18 acetylase RimI-like enzyme [Bradyrhizobium liaoningense]
MNVNQSATPPLAPELIAQFRKIVGDRHAITDATDIEPYVTEERNLFHGRSPLVLRPGSTAEVSAICKLASAHKIALVPQGGNTGLVGGQTPHNGEVVVSLRRLDKIREVDTASNTMTCEAGVVLQIAQARAAEVDRLFPLSLGAEGSCTIGGNLSTNAGGTAALAYGVAREMALGLEVVLADGRVLNLLSKLKKDNTGYNLHNLFIGAEGTLGIITAATLKLFPRPRAVETAFVGLKSPAAALELLTIAQGEAANALTSFELLSEMAVDFSVRHGIDVRDPLEAKHPWYVLMELSSPGEDARTPLETILARAMEEEIVDDAVIAANLTQRAGFWKLRDEMSAAQKPEGGSIKHDISVPVAAVPAFIAEADAAVVKLIPGARPVPFGHLGDGNLHYNVSQPVGANTADFLARWHEMNAVVFEIVLRMGGLDLGRTRHRRAQARRAAGGEGQDRDRADALHQGDARSARHHESGEGAVSVPPAPLAIRAIADADVEKVVALWQRCGLTRPWNDPHADIALARRRDNSTVLVGRDNGAIVATVMVGHDGHRGWVYYVAVDPDSRKRGHGRVIMAAAEDWLRAAGIPKLQLLVRRENAQANAFYGSLGFEESTSVMFQKWLDGRATTPIN